MDQNQYQNKSHFYLVDLLDIYKKHLKWMQMLPRVKPFYMLKCNQLPEIISLLSSLGTGFCCTNKQELDRALGTKSSDIIVSNPCKTRMFVKQIKAQQVQLVTFNSEDELHKMASLYPNAKLVLNIETNQNLDGGISMSKLNQDYLQFGTDLEACHGLLKLAKQLDLNVVGVSFHLGSDWQDPDVYYKSIATCRSVFEMALELGHSEMSLLDIGGGFPASINTRRFEQVAAVINEALDTFFPRNQQFNNNDVQVIAEPGRFYVGSSMTLLTKVIQKHVTYDDQQEQDCFSYSLGDGVYGAFNELLIGQDTAASEPQPQLLNEKLYQDRKLRHSILRGPTPDPMDCIKRNFFFPELEVGDWLAFKNKGAYSNCLTSSLNNLDQATVVFANHRGNQQAQMQMKKETTIH